MHVPAAVVLHAVVAENSLSWVSGHPAPIVPKDRDVKASTQHITRGRGGLSARLTDLRALILDSGGYQAHAGAPSRSRRASPLPRSLQSGERAQERGELSTGPRGTGEVSSHAGAPLPPGPEAVRSSLSSPGGGRGHGRLGFLWGPHIRQAAELPKGPTTIHT